MNSANIYSSKRLQRVFEVLLDGKEHTTRDIMLSADVCAVNSCIAELRDNGYKVTCKKVTKGIHSYRMEIFLANNN